MLLLVTDTSGRNGSVALVRAGEPTDDFSPANVNVIEVASLTGGMFSAQLVPQIGTLLANHGFRKTDIDAFVVVSGPGSFTGLRVGLAAIKGLAEILKKPIVPLSLLELVAVASHAEGALAAALDAGRDEVYVGEYQLSGGWAKIVQQCLLTKEEFLSAAPHATVATPDDKLAALAREAGLSVCSVALPGAEAIAQLGWRKLKEGETVTPEQLEANYIRRTDAEILAKVSS
jgi:tRNA threonylcarbamoyladenosine biosynthesis protein TsaB